MPNTLQDGSCKEVALKKGAEVDVTIEAGADAKTDTSQKKKAQSDGNLRHQG